MWPEKLLLLDYTLPTLALNLGLDEALACAVEAETWPPTLRVWEQSALAVAVGRSQQVDREVFLEHCQTDGVPIVRRSTGGGAVVLGTGCLAYTLVLPLTSELSRLGVSQTTCQLLGRIVDHAQSCGVPIFVDGTGDLVQRRAESALHGRKFSGSAQRWLRRTLLHHGTWLREFDLPLLDRYLRHPSREPGYRAARLHHEFVANCPLSRRELTTLLASAWQAEQIDPPAWLLANAQRWATEKFETASWNFQLRTTPAGE